MSENDKKMDMELTDEQAEQAAGGGILLWRCKECGRWNEWGSYLCKKCGADKASDCSVGEDFTR